MFLNRDHIVSVTIHDRQVTVTTTDGRTSEFALSDVLAIAKFADDLANSVQSNLSPLSGNRALSVIGYRLTVISYQRHATLSVKGEVYGFLI